MIKQFCRWGTFVVGLAICILVSFFSIKQACIATQELVDFIRRDK